MSNSELHGTPGGGSRPVPDPTVLTTEQLERAIKAERERVDGQIQVLEERLAGIDRATELRLKDIIDIPKIIDEKIRHLKDLTSERFDSIGRQLDVAESQRVEQKEDSKTGLDAALAAQKEAASEQNKSNTLAINKSEQATSETITKLSELFETRNGALGLQFADLKERVQRIEGRKQGEVEQRIETRAGVSNIGTVVAIIGGVLTIMVVILSFYLATHK